MIDGILNIYKEKGYTSHDVVAKLRGILKQKKIGHTGTLDPDAQGVLPVCLGKGTKLCDMLTDRDKVYRAVLLLGQVTDTQDTSGTVLRQSPVEVSEQEIREAAESFLGAYSQVPPMYSALKINGVKLCDLARSGKTVERKPRDVTIYDLKIESVKLPRVTMTVSCSKGTYIRTLCQDIGEKLGCGGCMESLVRLKSGRFSLEESLTLSEVEELMAAGRILDAVIPIDRIFEEYPALHVEKDFLRFLENGNPLESRMFKEKTAPPEMEQVRVYDESGIFWAVYGYKPEKRRFEPVKMFR